MVSFACGGLSGKDDRLPILLYRLIFFYMINTIQRHYFQIVTWKEHHTICATNEEKQIHLRTSIFMYRCLYKCNMLYTTGLHNFFTKGNSTKYSFNQLTIYMFRIRAEKRRLEDACLQESLLAIAATFDHFIFEPANESNEIDQQQDDHNEH